MTQKSFLNHARPLVTSMIRDENTNKCIASIKNSIYDGADAFGLHLSCLSEECRNTENYKKIFSAMGQRPVYLTSYRGGTNLELTDSQRMDVLQEAISAGGTLCDIMGDTFDESPLELTFDKNAIKKQMNLIDKLHSIGGEVLMSSHVLKFLKGEDVLQIALEHKNRGADISKIVTAAFSEEEELENIQTTHLLKKELGIPFLFLTCGTHYKIQRLTGPMLGNCMQLCMQQHSEFSAKFKPVLRVSKFISENVDWYPDI